MLSNPVAENAVNGEAAQMLVVSPAVYRQTVLDCVLASKRIEGSCVAVCITGTIWTPEDNSSIVIRHQHINALHTNQGYSRTILAWGVLPLGGTSGMIFHLHPTLGQYCFC